MASVRRRRSRYLHRQSPSCLLLAGCHRHSPFSCPYCRQTRVYDTLLDAYSFLVETKNWLEAFVMVHGNGYNVILVAQN